MKDFLGHSYKDTKRVMVAKTKDVNFGLRHHFIPFFIDKIWKWKGRNWISIDETSWYVNTVPKKTWSFMGSPDVIPDQPWT